MLTFSNFKNAIPTNRSLKHAIKQTRIMKIHHSLKNSTNFVE